MESTTQNVIANLIEADLALYKDLANDTNVLVHRRLDALETVVGQAWHSVLEDLRPIVNENREAYPNLGKIFDHQKEHKTTGKHALLEFFLAFRHHLP